MLDKLAIIRNAIEEHHKIRSGLKLAGEAVNDLEAMSNLQREYTGWVLSATEALAEKQKNLQQAMSNLHDGLSNHFSYEEKYLPPIMGKVLMQTLLIEHRQIRKELDEAKSAVADLRLEGLKQEELLAKKSHMRQLMDNIYQQIEEHASKEEIVLKMAQKALEEQQKTA